MVTEEGRSWWPLLAVLAVALLTFCNCFSFPFVGFDDPRYVTDNPLVSHPLGQGLVALFGTPALGYPQPITVLSFALNRLIFGAAPWSFHLVNLVLHLVNVALVWHLARALDLSERSSALAAMIFGLHPLAVEPVCWVTGRKDLLATAFVLSGLALMLRGGRDAPFPPPWRWAGATVLCALGMGAKPSVAIAPILLGLVLVIARPTWSPRRLAVALTPLAAIGAALIVAAGPGKTVVDVHPRSVVDLSLDVLGAFTLQLGHVFFPVDLVPSYARLPGDPPGLAMAVGACALVAIGIFLLRPRRSAAFAGLGFAVAAYAPVSGVLGVNRWTADSYMYLPLVGISIALVAAIQSRVPESLQRVARFAWPALGTALAIDAFAHSTNWRTPEGIWLATIERYPADPVPRTELARTLSWEGRQAEANQAYGALDDRFPDFEWAIDERASARLATGDPERARALLERGIGLGNRACADAYWLMLLQGQIAPAHIDRAAVVTSFDLAFADMQKSIREPAVWTGVARFLREAGSDERAERADRLALGSND